MGHVDNCEQKIKLKNNYYIIGFMGVGKSTIGRKLEAEDGFPVIDTDYLIQLEMKNNIKTLIQTMGERYFRDKETKIIKRVSRLKGYVYILGGGALSREDNVNNLRGKGKFIYIYTPIERLFMLFKYIKRPIIERSRDKEKTIKELFEKREPIYRNLANYIILNDGKNNVKEMVVKYIKLTEGEQG